MPLLEINVISAHLPPLAKVLRTFAVVYMSPDNKFTTKVDHQGHTNPTWNYKISFHVDEKLLKQESSAITIEIYNVAWLRDLPLGTTRLFINTLSPPLAKNPNSRRVSLHITRPSGHLQGTLNLGVQLVQDIVPSCELKVGPILENVGDSYISDNTRDQDEVRDARINDNIFINEYLKDQVKNIPIVTRLETMFDNENTNIFTQETPIINMIEPEVKSETDEASTSSSFFMIPPPLPTEVTKDVGKGLYSTEINMIEPEVKPGTDEASPGSTFFMIPPPLPTEVTKDVGKGLYSTDCNNYESSVLDNWSEPNNKEEDHNMKWISEDQIPLKHDRKSRHRHKSNPEKRKSQQKGLMSCFGSAYGIQFSFNFGSKSMKKINNKNTKKNFHKIDLSHENAGRVYV